LLQLSLLDCSLLSCTRLTLALKLVLLLQRDIPRLQFRCVALAQHFPDSKLLLLHSLLLDRDLICSKLRCLLLCRKLRFS
jgi:hypothetical protein